MNLTLLNKNETNELSSGFLVSNTNPKSARGINMISRMKSNVMKAGLILFKCLNVKNHVLNVFFSNLWTGLHRYMPFMIHTIYKTNRINAYVKMAACYVLTQ